MNKKEFQSLLIPLSEKERLYKENPELSCRLYKTGGVFMDDSSGLTFTNNMFDGSALHGLIVQNQSSCEIFPNIVFSKQTRFSVVPPHKHDYLEMNYIYSGNCVARINDRETMLTEGDVCVMDVGVTHTIYPTGEDDIVLNCLMHHSYFNALFIERLTQSGPVAKFLASALNQYTEHDQYLLFHTSQNPLIKELFEDAFCEYLDPALCGSDVVDSYMTLIFIQLARCYQDSKEKEYHENKRNYLTEILRYIENNCISCTLKSTAEQFSFHPKYLSRAIRQATGQTFKELVTQAKLKRAAFLLRNTDQQIGSITEQCGWSNQTQFYKKFGETYGCTPKEYRDMGDIESKKQQQP